MELEAKKLEDILVVLKKHGVSQFSTKEMTICLFPKKPDLDVKSSAYKPMPIEEPDFYNIDSWRKK